MDAVESKLALWIKFFVLKIVQRLIHEPRPLFIFTLPKCFPVHFFTRFAMLKFRFYCFVLPQDLPFSSYHPFFHIFSFTSPRLSHFQFPLGE